MEILTPGHEKWEEFTKAMWGLSAACDHTTEDARSILQTIKGVDVQGTLEHFKNLGGYCDCEIRLNVCR